MKSLKEIVGTLERNAEELADAIAILKSNDFADGEFVLFSHLGGGYAEVKGQFGFKGAGDLAYYSSDESENGFHNVWGVVISVTESDPELLREFEEQNYPDGINGSYPVIPPIVVNNRGPYGVQYAYKLTRPANYVELDDYAYYLERLPYKNFVAPVEYEAQIVRF